MSLISRTYACDSGGTLEEPHTFEIIIERDQHPNFCPVCSSPVEGEPIPGRISIGGSAASRSVDMTYDLIEQSSQARAEMAEADGVPAHLACQLKVTDMHDNMREGDVAAKLPSYPNNNVGQFMRQAEQAGIHYGFTPGGAPGSGSYNGPTTSMNGQRVSGPTNDGLGAVQGSGGQQHQQTMAQKIAQGRINKPGS